MPEIKINPAFDKNNLTTTITDENGELILLEFQGKFETCDNVPLSGMEVGKLDYFTTVLIQFYSFQL